SVLLLDIHLPMSKNKKAQSQTTLRPSPQSPP
ncbi:hypothetical protein MNBD_PLANCTO02-1507, partial [hydrothermal vent metagenome]